MLKLIALPLLAAQVAAQCSLSQLVVSNGVAIFSTTDQTAQSELSMTQVADGATAHVRCNKGYLNSDGSDNYESVTCSGTAWSASVVCNKNKLKYGMKAKEAREICKGKFTSSTSQICGFWDAANSKRINGPCDAATDRKCPRHRDLRKPEKNYNYCACLVA